jgi:hypothetical protein
VGSVVAGEQRHVRAAEEQQEPAGDATGIAGGVDARQQADAAGGIVDAQRGRCRERPRLGCAQ